MRLLIVGQSYAPEPIAVGPYTTGLAEHFAARGDDVVVVTTFPHYPLWNWYVDRPPLQTTERLNGVEVRRIRTRMAGKPSTAASRIVFDSVLGIVLLARAANVKRADLIVCVSPPIEAALAALIMGRIWRVPSVILAQDLPVQAAAAVGMIRSLRLVKLGLRIEQFVYSAVDCVVVISSRFRDQLLQEGVDGSRIFVIPNWADLDNIRPTEPDEATRTRLGASISDILMVHSGNMGEKQALETVVNAARQIPRSSSVQIALVGDGPRAQALRASIESMSLDNVRVVPLQAPQDYPAVLAAADILLLSQARNVVDSVLPSKLLSYMAAGRPILAAAHPDSAAAGLIREAGCGLIVAPEDPAALLAGLDDLTKRPRDRATMGLLGRAYAESHFAKDAVLRQWERLLSRLVSGGDPTR